MGGSFFTSCSGKELYSHFLRVRELWNLNLPMYWGDDLDVRYRLTYELSKMRGKRILDVGSNVGMISRYASQANSVVGIDIETSFLNRAKEIAPKAEFIRASMDALPFENDSFDVVLFSHTVPGNDFVLPGTDVVAFREKTFREAFRVLRKGGTLLLTSPNREWRQWQRDRSAFSEKEGFLPVVHGKIFEEVATYTDRVFIGGWDRLPTLLGPLEDLFIGAMPPRSWRYCSLPPKLLCKSSFVWGKLENDFQKSFSCEPVKGRGKVKSIVLWAEK